MEPASELLIYQTEDGQTRIQTVMQGETAWLSLNQMAELFDRDKSVISRHISNVFDEAELAQGSVVAKFATTAADGKTYQVTYYNLDVIISVGYRVKSHRGTQFRQWATQRLREYIVKGFTMDDARLERGPADDYFNELVERVAPSAYRNGASTRRSPTSMPPASITARHMLRRRSSSPRCRTSSTTRSTA